MDIQELKDRVLASAKQLAKEAIEHAATMPGASGLTKEAAAIEYFTDRADEAVERVDNLIPGLSQYMDLPVVDSLEKSGIHLVVQAFIRRTWAALELDKL